MREAYSRAYDGIEVGYFSTDMLVQEIVLIENKDVQALSATHEVQLVNYLTATGIEVGLLLNFVAQSLQFKRKTRNYRSGQLAEEMSPSMKGNPVNPVNPVEKRW